MVAVKLVCRTQIITAVKFLAEVGQLLTTSEGTGKFGGEVMSRFCQVGDGNGGIF